MGDYKDQLVVDMFNAKEVISAKEVVNAKEVCGENEHSWIKPPSPL